MRCTTAFRKANFVSAFPIVNNLLAHHRALFNKLLLDSRGGTKVEIIACRIESLSGIIGFRYIDRIGRVN